MKSQVEELADKVLEKLERAEGQMIDVKMIAMTKEMKVVKGKIARLENNASIYEMILKEHKDMREIYSCKMNNSKTINSFIQILKTGILLW